MFQIALLGFLATTFASTSEAVYPKLFFSHSWYYDTSVCRSDANPLNDTWASEADKRAPELAAIWDADTSALLGQLTRDFGKGFSRKEYSVTLTACDASWSYGNPIVLRVLPYLTSYLKDNPKFPAFPEKSFSSLVFHELLHTWLGENFDDSKSALIAKYRASGEDGVVLGHLHLMAIQVLVYTELGRKDLLDFIDWNYSGMKDPAYPRAWQIVKDEGYQAFIAELKSR